MSAPHSDIWTANARAVPIEDEIARRGIRLNGKVDRCGPCPKCGGHDRFSINIAKQVFHCRGCEAGGGVIDLVMFLDGSDFNTARATLASEPPKEKSNGKDTVPPNRRRSAPPNTNIRTRRQSGISRGWIEY